MDLAVHGAIVLDASRRRRRRARDLEQRLPPRPRRCSSAPRSEAARAAIRSCIAACPTTPRATSARASSAAPATTCASSAATSLGVRNSNGGEHFKRLRNAYSEWKSWSDAEKSAGRKAATCQDCHMSLFPGVCVQNAGSQAADGCPAGTRFEARAPGERARGLIASSSSSLQPIASHWFTSVDLPLSPEYPDAWANDRTLTDEGVPAGLEARRDQLLRHTFQFSIAPRRQDREPARSRSRSRTPAQVIAFQRASARSARSGSR